MPIFHYAEIDNWIKACGGISSIKTGREVQEGLCAELDLMAE
jgi:hypothetical protein